MVLVSVVYLRTGGPRPRSVDWILRTGDRDTVLYRGVQGPLTSTQKIWEDGRESRGKNSLSCNVKLQNPKQEVEREREV